MGRTTAIVVLPFVMLAVFAQLNIIVYGSSLEIDATAFVVEIVDGDTFRTADGYKVRLADVNAPERGEREYREAKKFLASLIYRRTVYLDVDDIGRTDRYGRLICVVYVDYNSTHYKNVNKALVINGHAVIADHKNEFNPYAWTLYVPRGLAEGSHGPQGTLVPALLTLLAFSVALLLAIMIRERRSGKLIERETTIGGRRTDVDRWR